MPRIADTRLKFMLDSFGAVCVGVLNGVEKLGSIELYDGRWGAFEIKLGANMIDEAAKNLVRLQKFFIADGNARPPSVLCVICGMTSFAYRRSDGVYVVPITSLKP